MQDSYGLIRTQDWIMLRCCPPNDGGFRCDSRKIVYLVAGIYGVVIITPMFFMEAKIGRDLPPAINHPEYFCGFLGVTLAWQLVFPVLAKNPLRYRPVMIPAIVEKVSYGTVLLALHFQHRLPAKVLQIGWLDWLFAVLFFTAYVATRPDP